MVDRILYIGTIVNPKIRELYDLEYVSHAADNKKRGIIASIEAKGADTTIISPVFVNNNSFKFHRGRKISDSDLGDDLYIPPTIDIYGLNYIFLAVTTTILSLRLLFRQRFDAILFYDFQIETAVPAVLGSIFFRVSAVLEYEDGLFFHENTVIRWTAKVLRPLCSPFVDGAICVNEPLADLLATGNTTIVRGFPSIGMPNELPEPVYRQEETVVMFAGRFDTVRGIDTFLNVVEAIGDTAAGVKFWISGYGTDQELDHVECRVNSMNDERITYFGTLAWDEYKKRVVSSDILVNFQDPDNKISEYTFPSKLLDFMSASSIVVSTEMSDLNKYFSDKILIGGRTQQQLRRNLEKTIKSPSDSDTRRKRARQWIETECSRSSVGEQVIRVIKEAKR